LTLVLLLLAGGAYAQWDRPGGSSGSGRDAGYAQPTMEYSMKGVVTAVSDQTREITLREIKKDPAKAKTFVGVLRKGLVGKAPDGTEVEIKPSDLPIGATITVYYLNRDRKDEQGNKIKFKYITRFEMEPPPKG
jgi:hypothetical protein